MLINCYIIIVIKERLLWYLKIITGSKKVFKSSTNTPQPVMEQKVNRKFCLIKLSPHQMRLLNRYKWLVTIISLLLMAGVIAIWVWNIYATYTDFQKPQEMYHFN